MIQKLAGCYVLFIIAHSAYAQKDPVAEINAIVTRSEAEAHLSFLAADEMRGRNTGSPEIDIAANYIASYFHQLGLKTLPGAEKYFQPVELQTAIPPSFLEFTVEGQTFKLKEDLALMSGSEADIQGDIVFAGYGSREDLQKADVKGKIVVTLVGTVNENNITKAFLTDAGEKNKLAGALGATALVEIVMLPGIPWPNITNYLGQKRTTIQREGPSIPQVWMKNNDSAVMASLKETKKAMGSLRIQGNPTKKIPAKNVIAFLEGTDKKLKHEYIVISAHYDHVGVGKKVNEDSIYNGARDNAIGTVGLMETAKFLSKYPPKRSVLFIALTAEEKGLLGSAWYVDHPLVPLKQTVFNFNCDGAGYNDTTSATIIGLERTSIRDELSKACEAFGLKATLDPVPEQNLYERSDNINFAVKGIPAIDFAPGTKAFDEELLKYYHQPADEVSTLNFRYLTKYFRAYVYAVYLIANKPQKPVWTPGDKFEEAARKLYGK